MRMTRLAATLVFSSAVLALAVSPAQARSSRTNRNRDTGPYRLIDRDDDAARKKKEDERKKQAEERKRIQDERRKQQDDARKALEAQRKASVEKAKQAQQARQKAAQAKAKAKATKKVAARKGGKKAGKGGKTPTGDEREEEAATLREDADKAFDKGELLPGVKLLRQIVDEYGGTDAEKSAESQLDLLLSQEPFGPMILLGEGEERFGEMRYRCARNKFAALVQRFPRSEQAEAGRKRLDEIRDNDLLSKSLYTDEEIEDARLWFLAGSIHLENGRRGEAVSAYRRVIEEYPGCRFAKMAEEKLAAAQQT